MAVVFTLRGSPPFSWRSTPVMPKPRSQQISVRWFVPNLCSFVLLVYCSESGRGLGSMSKWTCSGSKPSMICAGEYPWILVLFVFMFSILSLTDRDQDFVVPRSIHFLLICANISWTVLSSRPVDGCWRLEDSVLKLCGCPARSGSWSRYYGRY